MMSSTVRRRSFLALFVSAVSILACYKAWQVSHPESGVAREYRVQYQALSRRDAVRDADERFAMKDFRFASKNGTYDNELVPGIQLGINDPVVRSVGTRFTDHTGTDTFVHPYSYPYDELVTKYETVYNQTVYAALLKLNPPAVEKAREDTEAAIAKLEAAADPHKDAAACAAKPNCTYLCAPLSQSVPGLTEDQTYHMGDLGLEEILISKNLATPVQWARFEKCLKTYVAPRNKRIWELTHSNL